MKTMLIRIKRHSGLNIVALMLAGLAIVDAQLSPLRAQGTAFTYQGRLYDGTNAANGNYDMRFQLWNALSGGSTVTGFFTNAPIAVSNGLFTTTLDFGAGVFTGNNIWLHIGVRSNGVAVAYTSLTVRQQLTPTPYAIYAETANAAGLSGTIPSAGLSGVNGSGLTSLNASQLSTGTVPNARLAPDVALTDASQTFTAANTFTSGGGAGRFTVSNGFTAVDTNLFTGLSLQYDGNYGESAIMSSYNDGLAYLSFYTKQGNGYPIAKQMIIDRFGVVGIDQQNTNNGFLNNGSAAGAGLTFGPNSGEGIASKRTVGGNQYGLDFYTSFARRLSLLNSGVLSFASDSQTILFPAAGAGNAPMIEMFASGTGNADRMVIAHSPSYLNWGLQYQDSTDKFNFLAGGTPVLTVALGGQSVGIGTSTPSEKLDVNGEFAVVEGYGGEQAYMGGDGAGGDVQFGSLNSSIDNIAFFNATKSTYMHIYCSSITIEGGADLAEPFKITAGKNEIPQGSVVVIDKQNPGHLKMSDQAYDRHVAGVVSGANGINPGIQMQQQGVLDGGKNVALTGRVYVQADTSNGPIEPGDLLTTSSAPGHAMKVSDNAKAQGAILGKAMTGLIQGQGMILVLVTLQ